MSFAHLKQNAFILPGVPGGQDGSGGTENNDTLTLRATAHPTPIAGANISYYAMINRFFDHGGTEHLQLYKYSSPTISIWNHPQPSWVNFQGAEAHYYTVAPSSDPDVAQGSIDFLPDGSVRARMLPYGGFFGNDVRLWSTSAFNPVLVRAGVTSAQTAEQIRLATSAIDNEPRSSLVRGMAINSTLVRPFRIHSQGGYDSEGWYFYSDFQGGTLDAGWTERALVGAGAASALDGGVGGVRRFTTGANAGDNIQIDFNNIRPTSDAKIPILKARVYLPSIAAVRIAIGLINDYTLNPHTGVGQQIAIELDPGVSANFQVVTRNGAGTTRTNTTIAVAATTWYYVEVMYSSTAGRVNCFINEVQRGGNITANVPTALNLQPMIYVEATGAAAKSLDVDKVWVASQR